MAKRPVTIIRFAANCGSYLLDGAISIDLLKKTLQLKRVPGEESDDFHTLGGFLMSRLGRVPAVADQIEFGGWRFEVMDMDRRRVDKVLAIPQNGKN